MKSSKPNKKDKINLSGKWTSSFIEGKKIYNESTNIIQNGDNIDAEIKLDINEKSYLYKFKGKINDNVTNGIYTSIKPNKNETGTISIKNINKNLLFGACTFLNKKKTGDIVQSPYILIKDNQDNLGTYDFCQNCIGANNNCCCHPKVDMPVLTLLDVSNIKDKYLLKTKDFAISLKPTKQQKKENLKPIYQMKRDSITHGCTFYKNNKCQIYQDRPLDCRMFPFDIKLELDGNYYLISYENSICHKNINEKNIKDKSYNVRLFIKLLLPYLREYSLKQFTKRLSRNQQYTVVGKIDDLF